jgi:hypothetical protein
MKDTLSVLSVFNNSPDGMDTIPELVMIVPDKKVLFSTHVRIIVAGNILPEKVI